MFAILTRLTVQRDVEEGHRMCFLEMSDFEGACEVIGILKEGYVKSILNFSIFTHFLCFFLLKLLKLGETDGVKFLA